MGTKPVIFSVSQKVATIRFNRPGKFNAMNDRMIDGLGRCIVECRGRDDIRAVILTGDDKAFIAGADIEAMAEGDVNTGHAVADSTRQVQEQLADLDKPTIAAISGYALGGGLELALCCDFRLAADNAQLGLPEVTLGIIPGGGGTQRLPRLVGIGPATELLFLGEVIGADKALSIGLLNRVFPLADLAQEAIAFAGRLVKIPAVALRACKMSMRAWLNTGLKEGLQIEQAAFSMLFGTHDQKEGMAAFIQKRKPDFKGR